MRPVGSSSPWEVLRRHQPGNRMELSCAGPGSSEAPPFRGRRGVVFNGLFPQGRIGLHVTLSLTFPVSDNRETQTLGRSTWEVEGKCPLLLVLCSHSLLYFIQ